MATFTHNASEVIKSANASRTATRTAMYVANRRTADMGVEYVRQYIPPPAGAGVFPGYAARGALQKAVQARGPMPISGGVKSEIFMAQDRTRVYQRIHEYGGIIRARAGGWLRFRKPPVASMSARIPGNQAFEKGGYIFARAVRIRPKRYWSSGWRHGRARFAADFDRFFRQALKR